MSGKMAGWTPTYADWVAEHGHRGHADVYAQIGDDGITAARCTCGEEWAPPPVEEVAHMFPMPRQAAEDIGLVEAEQPSYEVFGADPVLRAPDPDGMGVEWYEAELRGARAEIAFLRSGLEALWLDGYTVGRAGPVESPLDDAHYAATVRVDRARP